MRLQRFGTAGLCAALSMAALAGVSGPGFAQEKLAVLNPGKQVVLRAGPAKGLSYVAASAQRQSSFARRLARIDVDDNGFSNQAREAFQRAVDIWEPLLDSGVTITVEANFLRLDPGVLGSAGPNYIWHDFPGADVRRVWYVDVLANKLRGRQLSPDADIVANFSSSFNNWHFGSGPAPNNRYDFTTVILHELGHGLGFIGGARVSADSASIRFLDEDTGQSLPIVYSRFVENGDNQSILNFRDPSSALKRQLESRKLFFDSPRVRNENRNRPAKLYAPRPFQPGSSYSHLDEDSFPNGNDDSLMTPFLSPGETIRDPGDITLAILQDLGW